MLFKDQPALVWGLLVSFFFGNIFLLVLNLPLAPLSAQVLRVPYSYLYPLILFLSLLGAFAVGNNIFTLWEVLAASIAGYFMKRFNFPATALVLGLILGLVLGPLLERYLVQTSEMGHGNLGIILDRPLSATFPVAAVAAITLPGLLRLWRKRRRDNELVNN